MTECPTVSGHGWGYHLTMNQSLGYTSPPTQLSCLIYTFKQHHKTNSEVFIWQKKNWISRYCKRQRLNGWSLDINFTPGNDAWRSSSRRPQLASPHVKLRETCHGGKPWRCHGSSSLIDSIWCIQNISIYTFVSPKFNEYYDETSSNMDEISRSLTTHDQTTKSLMRV